MTTANPSSTTSTPRTVHGLKPRLYYLDFVRALSALMIIIVHFNNPFLNGQAMIFVDHPFGLYRGSLGVSQFLIISGAALMYTYGDEDHLDLKTFYWKRFKSIYPMFWIAYIVASIYIILSPYASMPHAPKWALLLSLIGMDGYLANTGIPTFYLLGEWFLGFIVIFYIIFPLLRYGVKNHPWLTASITLILYLPTVILSIPTHGMLKIFLLTARLPELLFGMYFVYYFKQVPNLVGVTTAALLTVQQIWRPIREECFAVTLVGICFFLFLVWISQWLTIKPIRTPISTLSKYSYASFLVHHQVIMQVFVFIDPRNLTLASSYAVFLMDFIIIMTLSAILKKLNTKTLAYTKTMFSRPWK